MRVLVLGGTSEASALARRFAGEPDIAATLSLAGRTERPGPSPIPSRVGGFGGAEGLATYLRHERIDAVVDATHPFAARITVNAIRAAEITGVPLVALTRPAWSIEPGDRWTEVADVEAAVDALGRDPVRAFLTVGRLSLGAFEAAPQHTYLIRTIDPPETIVRLPSYRSIAARGPFSIEAEEALMRTERVDVVVSKNSGGDATYAKLMAARRLGLPVVLIRRPATPGVVTFTRVDEVMTWLEPFLGADCAGPHQPRPHSTN